MERSYSRLAALLGIGLFGFLGSVWSGPSTAWAAEDPGVKVFVEKRCYTCHTVNARAAEVDKQKDAFIKQMGAEPDEEGESEKPRGGDLSDVGKKRDRAWLESFLKNPKPQFKDDADCQKEAKKKDRKKFKGTPDEFSALMTFLTSLKQDAKQAPGFASCLKE